MDDLISRQAAIDAIKDLESSDCFGFNNGLICAMNRIAELPSAQQWIPVSERLPENFEEVNITWVNHNPAQYYADIKDVPFVASGVFYKGRWYWWSAVCVDYLREYGNSLMDTMDDRIEVIAWKPMPEPYKEEEMRSVEEINQAISVLRDVCQHYPVSCEGCPLESGDWCVLEREPESWEELEEDEHE